MTSQQRSRLVLKLAKKIMKEDKDVLEGLAD